MTAIILLFLLSLVEQEEKGKAPAAKESADFVAASRVKLPDGPLPLSKLLAAIQKQTGNTIRDLRSEFNQETKDPEIELPEKEMEFWKALDAIAKEAEISFYHHLEDRAVGVTANPAVPNQVIAYSGAFRMSLDRLILQHDFTGENKPAECVMQFGVLFEPRLKPLLAEVDAQKIEATDDKGRPLPLSGPEVLPIVIDEIGYEFPLIIKTECPPRDATLIARLAGTFAIVIPKNVESFEFPNWSGEKPQTKNSEQFDIETSGFQNDDGVWSITITTKRKMGPASTESHLQAALRTEAFLKKPDGTTFAVNGGFSTLVNEPTESRIEFLFVDLAGKPEDYTLLVKAPGSLERIPVNFQFRNIELP